MKTIIAGSRTFGFNGDRAFMEKALSELDFEITEVVSGTAIGADWHGEKWARLHNIPIKQFPANWKEYGTKAGPLRNIEMAKYADACVVFWDGKSKGSKHMIQTAKKYNLILVIPERKISFLDFKKGI